MDEVKNIAYSCSFCEDVICSYKKCNHFVVLDKCFKCSHYRRFMDEMDDEEEKFFEEVEKMRGTR